MRVSDILRQPRTRRSIVWSNTKLIFDGDSLMASHASSVANRVPGRMVAYPPSNGAAASAMLAIGGQTIQDMIDNAADVDAAFDSSKLNILVTFAGTNGMVDGPAIQSQRMRTYIAARKAANPGLLVVLGGLIPRYEASSISIALRNDYMVEYNKILEANWRTWGVSAYADLRPKGGPFDLPDWTLASFTRAQTLPLWSTDDAAGVYTHLSDVGAAYVARILCAALRRIPV